LVRRDREARQGAARNRARNRASTDVKVPEEERIDWRMAELSTIESAMSANKPIVLFFVCEEMDAVDVTNEVHDEELAKLAQNREVTFLIIEHNADRTPRLTDGSPIPTSRLTSPNPGREYDIRRYPTVVVCDQFGNPYQDFGRVPPVRALKTAVESVEDEMKAANERLQRDVEAAEKALEDKNMRAFFNAATRTFRTGVVGLEASERMRTLYRQVIDEQRKQIEDILDERPEDGVNRLRDMSRNFRGTELASEIDEAIAILRGR
jgi:predicted component of type VI protein secretion system